jgi:hypothetical protein
MHEVVGLLVGGEGPAVAGGEILQKLDMLLNLYVLVFPHRTVCNALSPNKSALFFQ